MAVVAPVDQEFIRALAGALGMGEPSMPEQLMGLGFAGAIQGMPMKERVKSLMESPFYHTIPLKDRLQLVKEGTRGVAPGFRQTVIDWLRTGKGLK